MACDAKTCGAARPALVGFGWVCDGADLVVVIPGTAATPAVVVRADLIPYVDDSSSALLAGADRRLFDGGDHRHLIIPIPLIKPRGSDE